MSDGIQLYVNIILNVGVAKPDEGTNSTVRRFAEVLGRYGLKGDFYLRGDSAQAILSSAPEVIELLKTMKMPIAYHSEARPPYPILGNRIQDMSWDDAVAYVRRYETEKLDPDTGKLDPDPKKFGGLKAIKKIFGTGPSITGRFFGPEIPYVYKEMGTRIVTFMTLPEHFSCWYMGLLCRPGNIGLGTPSIFRALTSEKAETIKMSSPREQLEVMINNLPKQRRNLLTYGGHVADFGQEGVWELFEDALTFIAEHPKIRVVTAQDIWNMVQPLKLEQSLSLETVHRISDTLAWKNLPDYIDLEPDYYSLADAFQALASCLALYHKNGRLPKTVTIREVLGPTDDLKLKTSAPRIARVKVDGENVLKAASNAIQHTIDRIPSTIPFPAAEREVNPAELLYAMAKTLQIIKKNGAPGPIILEPKTVLPPLASSMKGRFETTRSGQRLRLQFWTIKPATLKTKK